MERQQFYRNWIDRLRSWTAPVPRSDDRLPLGELEAPFRAAVKATEAGSALPRPVQPAAGRPEGRETRLWRARTEPEVDVAQLIDLQGDGPLISQDAYLAIEVWTDAELSALHALWCLSDRANPDCLLRRRLERAARWHLEHTQPDNATNRPWAIHVFLTLETPEAEHYAQTLLHNALASGFEVEPLAKWILIDTIRALENEIEAGQD